MMSRKLTFAALAIAEVAAVVAVAAAAAVVPALAHASSDSRSAAACAGAVAITMAPAGAEAPKYKLNYQESMVNSSIVDYYATRLTFEMQIADPKSGLPIAHAVCTTRRDGSVVKLTVVPLNGTQGKFAAQL
jgi:hypothetical protein